jgi:carbonic anhydrase/acetyltransferase-like protein (isoleucine patch superfamily)
MIRSILSFAPRDSVVGTYDAWRLINRTGSGAIICPNLTIGDRCIIGAGSVVTRDIPADVIAAGKPARVLRSFPKDET